MTSDPEERRAFRYYWCVNCGHNGDYGKIRKTKLVCEECGYDDVTEYTEEEIKDHDRKCLKDFKRKRS